MTRAVNDGWDVGIPKWSLFQNDYIMTFFVDMDKAILYMILKVLSLLYCMTLQFVYVFFIAADPVFQGRSTERQADIRTLLAAFEKHNEDLPGGFSGVGSRCPYQVGTTDEAATLCNRPWQGEESAARGPGEANESPLRLERLSDICDSQWQKSKDLFLQLSKELSDRLTTAKEGLVSRKFSVPQFDRSRCRLCSMVKWSS